MPDAPLEALSGLARVAGSEARATRIEVLNRSDRAIRYFEIGWIIKDRSRQTESAHLTALIANEPSCEGPHGMPTPA